jgi:hypothetical protein
MFLMTNWRRVQIAVLISLTLTAGSAFAQPAQKKGPPAAPKNLKLLPAANLRDVMEGFNKSLGVQCVYCHVQGDMASDENPKKAIARNMIALVRKVEPFFPTGGATFPGGYHEVDCLTCHQGKTKPETTTTYYFINKREATTPPTDNDKGVNLKVLPADWPVHGAHSIMEDFRDALHVDCGFCHGGPGGFANDSNPRKDISRKMIEMTRLINAEFPGTGRYPEGNKAVTCFTCHAGSPHPQALANIRYEGPIPPVQ